VLNAYLILPDECAASLVTLNGMEFRCIFGNDVYRVYEVSYSPHWANSAGTSTSLRGRSALVQ
jgi:hypothetical protein